MSVEIHVLIVDDDPSILEVLDARLSAAGFLVHKASDGATALQILKNTKVDILVSDMKMPEMSGMELLALASASYPQLPVIFLTAYGTIPDAVNALQCRRGRLPDQTVRRPRTRQKDPDNSLSPPAPLADLAREDGFIWGVSPAMLELREMLQKVAGKQRQRPHSRGKRGGEGMYRQTSPQLSEPAEQPVYRRGLRFNASRHSRERTVRPYERVFYPRHCRQKGVD